MKLTLQTQLFPSREQADALEATMRAFNAAADWLAGEAFAAKTANKIALQKAHYAALRERFSLSAQMAVRCIAQVCEAYKRDKTKRPRFRPLASMPFDQRMMSFKGIDRVSLLTLDGRIIVPLVMGQYQAERFSPAIGQCDLVRRRDGKWFLLVTVDLPDGTKTPTTDFVGVDLGVANIATTSDGAMHSGDSIEACRQRYANARKALQRAAAGRKRKGKRPRAIRRRLRSIGGREARFRKDVNHCISKTLVATAKGTGRGIALEDLKGIRDRIRLRRRQRARVHGWSFHQLRRFIAYKARLAGVDVLICEPHETSRTCTRCGAVDKANRRSQSEFRCRHCGHKAHADINAAQNIRAKATVMWPKVSGGLSQTAEALVPGTSRPL
jgi:IS605 OrfB family transposase